MEIRLEKAKNNDLNLRNKENVYSSKILLLLLIFYFVSFLNCGKSVHSFSKNETLNTDTIVFVRVYKRKFQKGYLLSKISIINDTLFLEPFTSGNADINCALFGGPKIALAVIKNGKLSSIPENGRLSDVFNSDDYFNRKPRINSYWDIKNDTMFYVDFPSGSVNYDSLLKVPILTYYFVGVKDIKDHSKFNISSLYDSIKQENKYSVEHPIYGRIDHWEWKRGIDSIYFLKGSYEDIKRIEKRIGMRK